MAALCMVAMMALCVLPAVDMTVTPCDHNFMARLGSGILTSPNFPLNYSVTSHQCYYRIYNSATSLYHLPISNMAPTTKEPTSKPSMHRALEIDTANTSLIAHGKKWRHLMADSSTRAETVGNQEEVACFQFQRFSLGNSPDNCEAFNDAYLEFPGNVKYCNKGWLSKDVTKNVSKSVFENVFCWSVPYPYLTIKFSYTNKLLYTDTGFYATFNITKGSNVTDRPENEQSMLPGSKAPCPNDDFVCFDDQTCVPRHNVCNGVDDCQDGSDEDYSNARCKGKQDYSACDFEDFSSMWCHFTGYNWIRDTASKFGPRYDHTIGITGGPGNFMYTVFSSMERLFLQSTVPVKSPREPCARCFRFWYFMSGKDIGQLGLIINTTDTVSAEKVWSRTGHQGSLWLQGEVDIPDYIRSITVLGFLGTKGDSIDANIAIDDLSLTEGACYGDDISCTFELSVCGWHLDDERNFSPWTRLNGLVNSTRPPTDCGLDQQGWYMHTNFAAQLRNRTRMVSRAISNIPNHPIWCLTYCYYKDGAGSRLNSTKLSIKLKHVDGSEELVHSVDRGTDKYWDEQKLLLKGINRPIQVIFEAVSSSTVEISIDSITMIPDPSACYSSITTTPPLLTTIDPGPVTCGPHDFRCEDGECLSSERVCDGRFDCKDFSDEGHCGYAGLSIGAITGIVSGLLLGVIICLSSFLWMRKRSQTQRTQSHSP